jgi:hypothetical protein
MAKVWFMNMTLKLFLPVGLDSNTFHNIIILPSLKLEKN